MRMDTAQLKIGELARRTGLQVETIRYYEREGLLPAPARSEGNYRLYSRRMPSGCSSSGTAGRGT